MHISLDRECTPDVQINVSKHTASTPQMGECKMTKAEETFLNRMIAHLLAGKSFEEAGRAVLADDERLWLAATEKSEQGEAIRSELAAQVYSNLRKAA
jgi:hypothetical protein